MTILLETQVWQRRRRRRGGELTEAEQANVKAAMRILHLRLGTWTAVARAMGTSEKMLERVLYGPRRPAASHALSAARLVKAQVEDVLSGAWPPQGMCPMCGHRENAWRRKRSAPKT